MLFVGGIETGDLTLPANWNEKEHFPKYPFYFLMIQNYDEYI